MKMNGVIIMRISDFKRFFDFQEFWSHKEEFIDLFNQEGYMDFFCITEEERILSKCTLDWLKGKLSLENANKFKNVLEKKKGQILSLINLLKNKNQPNSTIRGIISLSMLVSDTLCVDEIEKWLEIIKGNNSTNNYYLLYEDREFDSTDAPSYPLVAKPIVNNSSNAITIIVGENKKELSSGDCVVGLFDVEGKCYKLLPNKGNNGDVELRIKFNITTKRTDLEIKGLFSNNLEEVQNVISFFLDKKGYIYFPYENRGSRDFIYKSTLYIPFLYDLNEFYNILTVNDIVDKYEVITTNDIIYEKR